MGRVSARQLKSRGSGVRVGRLACDTYHLYSDRAHIRVRVYARSVARSQRPSAGAPMKVAATFWIVIDLGSLMPKLSKLRDYAYNRQDGKCWYCDCAMRPASDPSPRRCTAEHLHARCDGGKDVPQNIVAACWLCNNRRHRRKAPKTPEDYRNFVRERVAQGRWIVFDA